MSVTPHGFVVHVVTKQGAHAGWWRREVPHLVDLARADRFATLHAAHVTSSALGDLSYGYRGEAWSLGLAEDQGCRGVMAP